MGAHPVVADAIVKSGPVIDATLFFFVIFVIMFIHPIQSKKGEGVGGSSRP